MSAETKSLCYNSSCRELVDTAQNTTESCLRSSELPLFHDCNKKKGSCCETN